MYSQIPLPTDNIYKFYALFGLLLLFFSIGIFSHYKTSTNQLAFDSTIEWASLQEVRSPTSVEKAKMAVINRKLNLVMSDRKFVTYGLGILIVVSIALMGYGFIKWHKEVQPVHDELMKLTIEKMKNEISVKEC